MPYYKIIYYKYDSTTEPEFTEYFDPHKLKVVLEGLNCKTLDAYLRINKNVKSCEEITYEQYKNGLIEDNRRLLHAEDFKK